MSILLVAVQGDVTVKMHDFMYNLSHCDVTLGVAFCWQQHSIAILFSSDIAVVVALNLQVTEVVMALFLCSDDVGKHHSHYTTVFIWGDWMVIASDLCVGL